MAQQSKRGRGGRAAPPPTTTTPTPISLTQVAAMLERATRAVRTATHPFTVESVRAMTDQQILQDPALSLLYDRGWNACAAAVAKTARQRTGPQPPAKRARPSGTTPATPQKPATERVPPLPSTRSESERAHARGFIPKANPRSTSTKGRGGRQSTARGNSGTPGNRPTTSATPEVTSRDGRTGTAKQRNYQRFQELVVRKKARKATASSQQHRLAKHPGTSDPPTPSCSPTPTTATGEQPMDTSELPPDMPTGASSRDDEDVYLDAHPESLPDADELEEPPSSSV